MAKKITGRQLDLLMKLLDEKNWEAAGITPYGGDLATMPIKLASGYIDALLAAPYKPGKGGNGNGASPKQLALIERLLSEKDTTGLDVPEDLSTLTGGKYGTASALIDALFKAPRAGGNELATPGYYAVKGKDGQTTVYVVTENRNGRHVAKRLVPPSFDMQYGNRKAKWVYAKGMVYRLAGHKPLTVQEAANFGHLHGYCVVCGAPLTDPLSVETGIGPVCIKKFGTTQKKFLADKNAAAPTNYSVGVQAA